MRLTVMLVVIVALMVYVDYAMTVMYAFDNSLFMELSPVIRMIYHDYGSIGLFLWKTLELTVILGVYVLLRHVCIQYCSSDAYIYYLVSMAIATMVPVIYNAYTLCRNGAWC